MKQVFFCLLFIVQGLHANAQPRTQLKEVFALDTILYLDDFKDFDQYNELCTGQFDNNYYVAYFDKNEKPYSFTLYALDILTFKITKQAFNISKSVSKRLERAVLNSFVITNTEAIFFIGGEFLTYDRISHKFLASTPYDYDISFLKNSGSMLWYGYCYNKTKPVGKNPKSMVGRISLKENKYNEQKIAFQGIEFTHFEPNHFMDATENSLLFAQTLNYRINIYDTTLQQTTAITRVIENWNPMDTSILKGIALRIPVGKAVDLIDALVPYHNGKISRLDGAWFVNDSTLLARYYMPIVSADFMKYKYYFDVWTKPDTSSEWILVHKDLTDEDNLHTTKSRLTKSDIPLKSWLNPFYVGTPHTLVLKNTAKVLPYNDSYATIKAKQKEYIQNNNPVTAIYLYKFVK